MVPLSVTAKRRLSQCSPARCARAKPVQSCGTRHTPADFLLSSLPLRVKSAVVHMLQ